ncbi:hypothetical protein K505DRAFT_358991 [Melanomma pulvis-pyrius CBS 109.77]|uniref:Cytochrome P450 n=1 Tax=Melanomma pulvis-pyrius CBS 109.77 TaxID=1314802 RepID=A0A6A6XKN2_9PLEO|nr:hypothetical protein K505DRAFT_358991 [Melanomma pulvis-pyrius CBS 109.77]
MYFILSSLNHALVAVIVWTLYSAYWRLCLSPVAEFPGRKLAAPTFWYEFYYDFIRGGVYVYEIEKMHMLASTRYFVLANLDILTRLLAVLETVTPDPTSSPSQQVFESLPYLNADTDEGFRMSYGSMHRLSRSHPKDTIQFRDRTISLGTPVSFSNYLLHSELEIFPHPPGFTLNASLTSNQSSTNACDPI